MFVDAAVQRLLELGARPATLPTQVFAVDVNPDALRVTARVASGHVGAAAVTTRHASFFDVESVSADDGRELDAVIGNPPYIRYQDFSGPTRRAALERATSAGVRLSELTSSWAPFVVHAATFLRRGGRLAMILPAELVHAIYAAPVRAHLRTIFDQVTVVSFRHAVFPDVQEEVVLLLADGKRDGAAGELRLVEASDSECLADLDALFARAELYPAGIEPTKWLVGHTSDAGGEHLTRLVGDGRLTTLSTVGKANIGYVSGANEYFVLTDEQVKRHCLPRASIVPSVSRARHLRGVTLGADDLDALGAEGEPRSLWLPGEKLTAAERRYVSFGESSGVAARYKCRVRSPWYRVPGVVRPDAFLTYMSDTAPRLALNEAGAAAANTLLVLRLPGVPVHLRRAFVIAFYNSATLLSCERIARSYGGGVLKLEPREADRVLVPSLKAIASHASALELLAPSLRAAWSDSTPGALERIVVGVDALLWSKALPASQVNEIRTSRATLLARRKHRARPAVRR